MKDAEIADGDDVMVKHCDHYDDGDVVVALLDVIGKRFRDYLRLATDLTALLNN